MRVEYGPPGHKGVTQIMGLGAEPSMSLTGVGGPNRQVGVLSAITLLGGMVIGSDTARNIGIGGLLAVAYIHMQSKKTKTNQQPPTAMQGWG